MNGPFTIKITDACGFCSLNYSENKDLFPAILKCTQGSRDGLMWVSVDEFVRLGFKGLEHLQESDFTEFVFAEAEYELMTPEPYKEEVEVLNFDFDPNIPF